MPLKPRRFYQTKDGSVIDDSGMVIYFSVERFIRDICEGDCCFICGASPGSKEFNNEHVLPDWVIKRFKLAAAEIELPNKTGMRYTQYKIPCCRDCNTDMGRVFEQPIRELHAQGYEAFIDDLQKNGPWRCFVWLCLIFIKTHLKDSTLPLHRDTREGPGKLGDGYEWEKLHHIHCVARSFYTGARLCPEVLGTLLVLPVGDDGTNLFDYVDRYVPKAILLRLGSIALISVLDDSGAANLFFQSKRKQLPNPLLPVQLREILGHFAFLNLHLKERPVFLSRVDVENGTYDIEAQLPERPELREFEPNDFGEAIYECVHDMLPNETEDDRMHHRLIKEGRYTFLSAEAPSH
jgi:hypothetical protein